MSLLALLCVIYGSACEGDYWIYYVTFRGGNKEAFQSVSQFFWEARHRSLWPAAPSLTHIFKEVLKSTPLIEAPRKWKCWKCPLPTHGSGKNAAQNKAALYLSWRDVLRCNKALFSITGQLKMSGAWGALGCFKSLVGGKTKVLKIKKCGQEAAESLVLINNPLNI